MAPSFSISGVCILVSEQLDDLTNSSHAWFFFFFLLDFNQVGELQGDLNMLFLVLTVQIHRPSSTASSGFNSTKAISPHGMAGANEGQGPAAALPQHPCHSRGSTKHWWRKRLQASCGCLNFWFLIHLPRALLHCNDYHHTYTKF